MKQDDIFVLFLLLVSLLILIPLVKTFYLNYSRKRKYQQIVNELNVLFQDVNPFDISNEARKKIEEPPSDLHYGEIDLCALLDLIALIQPHPSAVFYDLGSGSGKSALAVKLRYPAFKVIGIELIESLHQVAQQKHQQYLTNHSVPSDQFEVSFINDNLLNQHFADADIIFINATAYSSATWEQILYKLVQLKRGAKVIITSKKLPFPAFNKHYQGMELMSWGLTSTYIYEKVL